MTADTGGPSRLRADAQQNHDRIVAAATRIFATEGEDASLTAIAQAAGVGIGTLYRRFGTREELVAEVNRTRALDVCDLADSLLGDDTAPLPALQEWLGALAAFLATRQGMAAALIPIPEETTDTRVQIRDRMLEAVDRLLAAARADGSIGDDVGGQELLRLITGVAFTAADAAQARGFTDLIVDGLQYRA